MKTRIYLISLITILSVNVSSQYVSPVKDDDLYSFQVANMYFEVDASFGGHVSSLKLNDEELMFVDRTYGDDFLWGSTLWPAPQDDWPSAGFYWFKYFTLDSAGYTGGIVNDSVVLVSDIDKGIQFRKIFYASEEDTSVTIKYYLKNASVSTIYNAPWELTRVPQEGITFFPKGEGEVSDLLAEYTQVIDSIVWYEYANGQLGNRKFKCDGRLGWFAFLNDKLA